MKLLDYWMYLALAMGKLYIFSLYTDTAYPASLFILNLSGMLLLSSWVLLLRKEKRRWFFILLMLMHSTLLISDMWYYRYFENFLSIALISEIPQMTSVGGGFAAIIQWTDFFLYADVLLFILLIFLLRHFFTNSPRRTRMQTAGTAFGAGLVLFIAAISFQTATEDDWQRNQAITNMREYYALGFWGYHGVDLLKGIGITVYDRGKAPPEEMLAQQSESTDMPEEQPNVIIVQLESFQTSVINTEINGQELTPHLNQLQEEMLYFPNFYHQTHEGRTSDAEFIVNSSLYPLKSGSVYPQHPENKFDALPEELREHGYDTAAFHAYEKEFWNRNEVYGSLGYNSFFSEEDYPDGEIINIALNDKDFFDTSLAYMETMEEPYFSFLVALTSHIPYDFPEEKQVLDLSGYEDPLLRGYYHTVHYVDEAVGKLVDDLKEQELWEDSIVVFYGDHDSGLTAPEGEMARTNEVQNEVDLFKLDRAVPLFIKVPGEAAGEVVEQSGGQIDLAPTILDLLDIDTPFMLGQSLLDEEDNLTVFRDGSFRHGELYYVPDLTEAPGKGTCYAMSSGDEVSLQDCLEQEDRAINELLLSDMIIEGNLLEEARN
ncbi:LTA synthase family protein [Alkalicoccus daliensis]|uniref:Phosphoglycerol transferase MdoB n=1 Tax=Alkalicoccus daliensis TaxID=745820 RepID=A0A1H0G8X6_9BACI|nr:LTA synthase family protein [Alkalicoccus daliensis]SDO03363.1 Phosphoglycerol transferase MdoB [Alkalicoccus daliensis]